MDELRQAIKKHKFVIRGKGRPKKSKWGKKERGKKIVGRNVSVSISIGVAERCNGLRTADDVIKAADKASMIPVNVPVALKSSLKINTPKTPAKDKAIPNQKRLLLIKGRS